MSIENFMGKCVRLSCAWKDTFNYPLPHSFMDRETQQDVGMLWKTLSTWRNLFATASYNHIIWVDSISQNIETHSLLIYMAVNLGTINPGYSLAPNRQQAITYITWNNILHQTLRKVINKLLHIKMYCALYLVQRSLNENRNYLSELVAILCLQQICIILWLVDQSFPFYGLDHQWLNQC